MEFWLLKPAAPEARTKTAKMPLNVLLTLSAGQLSDQKPGAEPNHRRPPDNGD
jgi:hypothetical protein